MGPTHPPRTSGVHAQNGRRRVAAAAAVLEAMFQIAKRDTWAADGEERKTRLRNWAQYVKPAAAQTIPSELMERRWTGRASGVSYSTHDRPTADGDRRAAGAALHRDQANDVRSGVAAAAEEEGYAF